MPGRLIKYKLPLLESSWSWFYAVFLGGTVIEFLAESGDVHAVLAQSGTDRRRGVGSAGRNLQFDLGNFFLGHCLNPYFAVSG